LGESADASYQGGSISELRHDFWASGRNSMHILKLIFRSFIRFAKNVLLFPQSLFTAAGETRQNTPNKIETERLDRIRNPSKYLGKE
jgi:hypothetical protein